MVFTPHDKKGDLPNPQPEPCEEPQAPLDGGRSPALASFQEELRRLRLAAGQPSFRAIAKDIGWSHSTIARAFTGDAAPKWDLAEALAAHLNGDPERLRRLWIASMDAKLRSEPGAATGSAESTAARFPVISAVAAICALLLVVVLRDLAPDAAHRNETISATAQFLFVATAALLWWGVYAKHRGRENLALALCLAGWSLIAARDIATIQLGKPFLASKPLVDIVVVHMPSVCLILLLLSFLRGPQRRSAIMATLCLVPAWSVVLLLVCERAAAFPQEVKIGFALYSAMHMADCFLVARVWQLKKNWTWALVLSGCAVLIAVDLLFAFLVAARADGTVPVGAAAGLLVCPLILIVAARCAVLEEGGVPQQLR
ncbi:MAG: helix-turn-helix domain-containing protein [Segniliparus sp.]|uniref:helix-turn-helix domain-containing protein n=1 Tax=Segniliparus sp. TaxID=2804064 RepID=UPI003F3D9EC4